MIPKNDEAWEAYRLYQRDILLQCFEDADLIVRRRHSLFAKEEALAMAQLLFDKRCQPWKFFRDEFRVQQVQRKRAPPSATGDAREPQPA